MDFLEEIYTLNDEDLTKRIKEKIEELEEQSKIDNHDINEIGFLLDYNPNDYYLMDPNKESFCVKLRCFYGGFIPKGMKMIYGLTYNHNGIASNEGRYYTIDDDSYLYDFCKYIKDKDIINEYELFEYTLDFMRDYFGNIKQLEREDMLKMIYQNKDTRVAYHPTQERGLSWFKNKGNAMCSEYAVMAQNILSLFDMQMCLVVGREQTGNEKGESHAFNFVTFTEKETGEEVNALIDFANFVHIYDMNFKKVGASPFIHYIDNLDEEYMMKFLSEDEHLVLPDYSYYILGDKMSQIEYERNRDYYVDKELIPDESVNKRKKI